MIDALRAAHPDGVDAVLDLVNDPDAIRRDAEIIRPAEAWSPRSSPPRRLVAQRQITAHNHASSANPLITPQGLVTVAQMLADGTITARIRSTFGLDAAGQILDELRHGGLRGKAVIRLEPGRTGPDPRRQRADRVPITLPAAMASRFVSYRVIHGCMSRYTGDQLITRITPTRCCLSMTQLPRPVSTERSLCATPARLELRL